MTAVQERRLRELRSRVLVRAFQVDDVQDEPGVFGDAVAAEAAVEVRVQDSGSMSTATVPSMCASSG